jgi:uroporphyrinogen decarboxylase
VRQPVRKIRDWIGVVELSYLQVDDPALFDEMIDTCGELCLRCTEAALATGARFDFAHFWEDICFKNGPLVNPVVFAQKVGPWYRRITEITRRHGLDICSLDCDGKIDALVPIWIANGVNTMFPIEVGTWNASIAPWRAAHGRELRGVGGMDKRVFAHGRAAVDAEIERLRPLVALGGFIPCPDHRIAPDAEWDTVRYYTDRMRAAFGS